MLIKYSCRYGHLFNRYRHAQSAIVFNQKQRRTLKDHVEANGVNHVAV